MRRRGSRFAIAAFAVYALGLLALGVLFIFTNEEGIEVRPSEFLPYYVGFTLAYGLVIGWPWAITFPAIHIWLITPLWSATGFLGLESFGTVAIGTGAMTAGIVLRASLEDRKRVAGDVGLAKNGPDARRAHLRSMPMRASGGYELGAQ